MATSASLSVDVIAIICDLLAPVLDDDKFDTPLERERQRELLSLSLVSHDWSVVARRALSRSIIVCTAAQAERIGAAAADGRLDATIVRSITLFGHADADTEGWAMSQAIDQLTQPETNFGLPMEDPRVQGLLNVYRAHRVREACSMMTIGRQLAERSTSLDVVRIGDVSRAMAYDWQPAWHARALVVDALQYLDRVEDDPAIASLCDWLARSLTRSADVVSVAIVGDCWTPEEEETMSCPFDAATCARLELFSLGGDQEPIRCYESVSLFPHPFTSLIRLHLHFEVWFAFGDTDDGMTVRQLFGSRNNFPSIRDLSIRSDYLVGRTALVELCEAAPVSLRRLALSWTASAPYTWDGEHDTADTADVLRAFGATFGNNEVMAALCSLSIDLSSSRVSESAHARIIKALAELGAVMEGRGIAFDIDADMETYVSDPESDD